MPDRPLLHPVPHSGELAQQSPLRREQHLGDVLEDRGERVGDEVHAAHSGLPILQPLLVDQVLLHRLVLRAEHVTPAHRHVDVQEQRLEEPLAVADRNGVVLHGGDLARRAALLVHGRNHLHLVLQLLQAPPEVLLLLADAHGDRAEVEPLVRVDEAEGQDGEALGVELVGAIHAAGAYTRPLFQLNLSALYGISCVVTH